MGQVVEEVFNAQSDFEFVFYAKEEGSCNSILIIQGPISFFFQSLSPSLFSLDINKFEKDGICLLQSFVTSQDKHF